MKAGWTSLVLTLALGACADSPVGVPATPDDESSTVGRTVADPGLQPQAKKNPGSGLELTSLTGLALPLIPIELGDVVIDQAVVTNLRLVEDLVGNIVGIEADGILQLTGGVLGTDVLTENFTTNVSITSSGPGQCSLITIDLSGINIDALGLANVDIPAATLTGKGSGAVGSLLCNLGSILGGLGGLGGGAVPGLVNGINNQIGQ